MSSVQVVSLQQEAYLGARSGRHTYHTEPAEMLRQTHDSVLGQTFPCEHVLVADGHPLAEISDWRCDHIVLPTAHGYGGALPRGIGALHALHVGATYVAFLDADNWYEPDHVAHLVALSQERRAPIAVSGRIVIRADGTAFDPGEDIPFIDTSTLMVHRSAYDILGLWALLPPELNPICDQILDKAIRHRGYQICYSGRPTMNFRTRYAVDYIKRGETPPSDASDNAPHIKAVSYWNNLSQQEKDKLLYGAAVI